AGLGLTPSPTHAACSKDCRKQIGSEFMACRAACGKDKVCRQACRDEKRADLAICKAATNPTPPDCGDTTTTTTTTNNTTTTPPSFVTCSPVGAACGSCGSGICFSPSSGATSGVCVDSANSSGTPCGIDPPIPCPPGELCVVVQFSPAMFVCARPCP